jgi:hypothetical protein
MPSDMQNGAPRQAQRVLSRFASPLAGPSPPGPGELPAEQELLLCCARTSLDPGQRDRLSRAAARSVSWDALYSLAESHGLVPLLYRHLAQAAAPEPFRERCRESVFRSQLDALGKCADLLELLDRFEREGVPVLPFKGAAAGAAYYGDPGLRVFNDADLLVPAGQARRAWELLLRLGYEPTLPLTPGWRAVDMRSRNERMFARSGRPAVVDLHWNLMPLYYSFTPPNDGLWGRTELVSLGGRRVATLGAEDALLFFCLHGAKHNWSRLRWVCDVAELVRSRPGLRWEWVLDWAGRRGAVRMVQVALRLARGLLSAPVPETALAAGEGDRAVSRLSAAFRTALLAYPPRPEPEAELPWHSYFYQSMDRRRDRLRWIYEIILLPGELEWELVPLPAAFAPLYFPVRLARLGWKYLQKRLSPGPDPAQRL